MSYIIVPALPKGALVEWHVVALENQIECQCKLKIFRLIDNLNSFPIQKENYFISCQ